MGVEVAVRGASEAELTEVRALFAERDCAFSRFRADSELTHVNRAAGSAVVVSPLFARMLRTALGAARRTGGLVDPTLGAALEAAGYDRDFDRLEDDPRPCGPPVRGARGSVRLDGRLLRRPPGLRLDLNGVVKGATVGDALGLLRRQGFVAAGGDVAVRGAAYVGLPGGETIRVLAGGLATSGTSRRAWRRGGQLQHHLIDPVTGRPSQSRWTAVTAAAGTCLAADVAAKAAFLLDRDGPDWLDGLGLPGRFVAADGAVSCNAAWRRALDPARATLEVAA
jgi:thiamine biosynthesis lipoprotein